MSRIGKKPISLPAGVSVAVKGQDVDVSGPKGKLNWRVPDLVSAAEQDKQVVVTRANDTKEARALHGLSRSLIANMVQGVHEGYERKLEVYGTGYGCDLKGNKFCLNIGFMGRGGKNKPQFEIEVPKGLEITIEVAASRGDTDPARFTVKGCDKQQVGAFAADVRQLRPPEPYKGKGIRYMGEHVRRKQGKALAGAGR